MKFDGKRLKALREAKGLTQGDLAKRIKSNRVSVAQWENGDCAPSIETVGKLNDVFGLKGSFFIVENGNGTTN